jgi:hypothetical protein
MSLKTTSESRINEESLDLIRCKMGDTPELGLGEEEVEMSVGEYRRFLILKMENPGVKLAPTGLMDKAWHTHILDTRRYAEDCETMFGRFLHHHPSYKGVESGEKENVASVPLHWRTILGTVCPKSLFVQTDSVGHGNRSGWMEG